MDGDGNVFVLVANPRVKGAITRLERFVQHVIARCLVRLNHELINFDTISHSIMFTANEIAVQLMVGELTVEIGSWFAHVAPSGCAEGRTPDLYRAFVACIGESVRHVLWQIEPIKIDAPRLYEYIVRVVLEEPETDFKSVLASTAGVIYIKKPERKKPAALRPYESETTRALKQCLAVAPDSHTGTLGRWVRRNGTR